MVNRLVVLGSRNQVVRDPDAPALLPHALECSSRAYARWKRREAAMWGMCRTGTPAGPRYQVGPFRPEGMAWDNDRRLCLVETCEDFSGGASSWTRASR
jgi:hypothetical protein